MQTTTAPKAGNAPDLLQGILSVQVRNEDKITEQAIIARHSRTPKTFHQKTKPVSFTGTKKRKRSTRL